jgi:hypothetical protein
VQISALEEVIEAGLIKGSIGPEYIDCLLNLIMREIRLNVKEDSSFIIEFDFDKPD